MSALVFGGAGFLGSWVVDALIASREDVVIVDDLSSGHLANLAGAFESGMASIVFGDVHVHQDEILAAVRQRFARSVSSVYVCLDEVEAATAIAQQSGAQKVIVIANDREATPDHPLVVNVTFSGSLYGPRMPLVSGSMPASLFLLEAPPMSADRAFNDVVSLTYAPRLAQDLVAAAALRATRYERRPDVELPIAHLCAVVADVAQGHLQRGGREAGGAGQRTSLDASLYSSFDATYRWIASSEALVKMRA